MGAELPAKNTSFLVASDSKKKVNISTTAVFSENILLDKYSIKSETKI